MEGFTMYKDEYAAVPFGKKGFIIIHNGQQLEKLCRTESSARKYIADHKNSEILWEQFFELLVFDALIGGTDRHYNNWGILEKADSGELYQSLFF